MAKRQVVSFEQLQREHRPAQQKEQQAYRRPKTRADCAQFERPCPFVSCRHHLFLEANPTGSLTFPYGQDVSAIEKMTHTCALDTAEQGEKTGPKVAEIMNISPQAMRLVYWRAMANMGTRDSTRDAAAMHDTCDKPRAREGAEPPLDRSQSPSRRRCKNNLKEYMRDQP